ncbi:MAG: exodeoxyribonuclease VII small subunit [Planctomycetota bacterium]
MTAKKKDSLKYGEAKEKLEKILREIEGDEVDVDDLGEKVKEAAQLIQVCREKLQKTRIEVEKVVSDMALDKEGAASRELAADSLDRGDDRSRDNSHGIDTEDDAPF